MKQRIFIYLPPFVLFLLTFALFAPSIGYELVNLDDPIFVVNNPIVFNGWSWSAIGKAFTELHGDCLMYTPLLWISYLLDTFFFRASVYAPWGFHLTNVFLHAINAVLLYFILLSAIRRPWLAFFAAAFWALHPLRVESVAWVTERKDTLSTLFAFASVLCYLKAFLPSGGPGAQPPPSTFHFSLFTFHCRKGCQCLALATFAAGLLSKPMLVTIPFLFLLLDYWPLRRFSLCDAPRTLPRLVLQKWPFFLLAAVASLVTYRLQDSAIITLPLSIRLLRLPVNYLFYLARTLWPVNLCPFFFGFPATPVWVLFACTVFLLLAAGAVRSFRHAPGILVGLLAFAGLLAPVSGIIFIGGVPVADRYSYLPALGLSLALLSFLDLLCGGVGAGAKLPPSTRHSSLVTRLCGGIAAAVVLAAEATVSLHILPFWKNPEALFERAEQIGPDHDLFQKHRFGEAFCTEGNLPSAATLSDTIFEKAPTSRYAILTKVLVLSQIQSSAAAVAFFEAHPPENRPNDPDHNPLALTLAALYADAGDFGMAAVHLGDALSNPNCFPEFRETVNAIAFWIYAIQNLPERAAAFARLVPSMDPDDPLAPSNFLIPLTTLWNMGLRRQILPRFLRLASTAPSNSALLNNIAWLLATTPNSPAPPDEVLAIARNACVLQPAHPVVRDTLAVALAFASRFDEAVAVEISVADFLRTSSAPEAPALLADVESRIALFRSRTPFTENAASKLLFAL